MHTQEEAAAAAAAGVRRDGELLRELREWAQGAEEVREGQLPLAMSASKRLLLIWSTARHLGESAVNSVSLESTRG